MCRRFESPECLSNGQNIIPIFLFPIKDLPKLHSCCFRLALMGRDRWRVGRGMAKTTVGNPCYVRGMFMLCCVVFWTFLSVARGHRASDPPVRSRP